MNVLQRKKGSVLVFSLLVLAIVLSSALSITVVNVSNRKSAASTAQSVQSFQVADTAAEKVMKAVYNGNYSNLYELYHDGLGSMACGEGAAIATAPGALILNNIVSTGVGSAAVSFLDTNGAKLADCTATNWRDTLASVKVEGSANGTVRVIEAGIAPLSSMAWGDNDSGQIGDGTTGTDRLTPVSTIGGSKWKSVSAGGSHTLAVKSDGTLWAWGNGANYRLGNDSIVDQSSPVQIGTDTDWESVSAGGSDSFAIKAGHTLWAWGDGTNYMLGNNSTNDVHTPTQITVCSGSCPAGGWKMVSAGFVDHTLAIGVDNSLWAWGDGNLYRLGNNSENNVRRPELIASCSGSCPAGGWKMVAAGDRYSIALGADDKLYVWGSAANYQLGNNDAVNPVHRPTLIPTPVGATWKSVAAGENHVLGVRSDGTLWSWGNNGEGQLGRGSTGGSDEPTPQQRGLLTDWIAVSAGARHSLALRANGANQELWTWGRDNHGQVGNGTPAANTGSMQPISGNWKAVDGGSTFSIGVRE